MGGYECQNNDSSHLMRRNKKNVERLVDWKGDLSSFLGSIAWSSVSHALQRHGQWLSVSVFFKSSCNFFSLKTSGWGPVVAFSGLPSASLCNSFIITQSPALNPFLLEIPGLDLLFWLRPEQYTIITTVFIIAGITPP